MIKFMLCKADLLNLANQVCTTSLYLFALLSSIKSSKDSKVKTCHTTF